MSDGKAPDVHLLAAQAYLGLYGEAETEPEMVAAVWSDIGSPDRFREAIDFAVKITEQRVREEAAGWVEAVDYTSRQIHQDLERVRAEHAAKMAEAAGVIEALERAGRQHRADLEHNEKIHLAVVAQIGAANNARIRALETDLAQVRDLNRELAARSQYLKSETERMAPASRMVADLDRCGHGRHEGDGCPDCPGGRSVGGPLAYPGVFSAYNYAGKPYAMPERGKRHQAEEWLREGRRLVAIAASETPEVL